MGKRFVREYALYKMKDIKTNELMRDHIKAEKMAKIERNLAIYNRGLISEDEAIKAILEA